MSRGIFLLSFLLTFNVFNATGQILNKILIGSWKTKQYDDRVHSETNEVWIFRNATTGSWERELIISDNAINCLLKNPFKWSITGKDQVKMTMGKTECNCKASEKKFEKGLSEFAQNLKAAYEGEYFEYKIKTESKSIIYFNNLKMTKIE
jgi:hypothetical protein